MHLYTTRMCKLNLDYVISIRVERVNNQATCYEYIMGFFVYKHVVGYYEKRDHSHKSQILF